MLIYLIKTIEIMFYFNEQKKYRQKNREGEPALKMKSVSGA